MQRANVHSRLQSIVGTLKPCLRVTGLAYAGLGGMLAMALVVSVALVPVVPALQQAAEPARQAVSNLVQPTSDAVTSFLGGAAVHAEPVAHFTPPSQRSFSDLVSLDVTIQAGVEDRPLEQASPAVASAAIGRAPQAREEAPDSGEAEFALEPDQVSALRPIEPGDPPIEPGVVVPAQPAVLQIASQDAPKPLPTLPAPTETALQVKARKDAENQAAIDAAKAAQVRAKAEADAANNAAIAASKATATASASAAPAAATAEATTAPTTSPTAVVTPTAVAQSKAATNAANQAAIDAAKLAQTRARAQSNAANQAALMATKGAKPSAKTMPTPTAQPALPPARPTAQPTPTASAVESPAPAVSTDVVEQPVDEASLEDAPIDQATTPSDAAAA